ncbi:RbsD/FucU family protein [Cellulomonas sp. McL0617]|uniref:RbsD/FucU family protein n=1 Tax=Cellulomonas sp. McL0617 TaxID=3415675 RepID=UPI003CFAB9EC
MLTHTLLHPGILAALAAAGHGSQVLVADANYPHSTGTHRRATRVHLNLRPGLVGVDDVLATLLTAIPVEAAHVMVPDDGAHIPAHDGFRAAVGPDVAWHDLDRFAFYRAARTRDVALVIATGDVRVYANVLLTIGVRAPEVTP